MHPSTPAPIPACRNATCKGLRAPSVSDLGLSTTATSQLATCLGRLSGGIGCRPPDSHGTGRPEPGCACDRAQNALQLPLIPWASQLFTTRCCPAHPRQSQGEDSTHRLKWRALLHRVSTSVLQWTLQPSSTERASNPFLHLRGRLCRYCSETNKPRPR